MSADQQDFDSDAVLRLREDLALALRAAALHGFAEGVCNHFSIELPDGSGRFLLNPRGLLWSEVGDDDIVIVDGEGRRLAGVGTPSSRRRCSSTPRSIACAARSASCTRTCRTRLR
jgi:ribulose-5-phosphate 4-epimerase/fuculose-1-phosphate aldolase